MTGLREDAAEDENLETIRYVVGDTLLSLTH